MGVRKPALEDEGTQRRTEVKSRVCTRHCARSVPSGRGGAWTDGPGPKTGRYQGRGFRREEGFGVIKGRGVVWYGFTVFCLRSCGFGCRVWNPVLLVSWRPEDTRGGERKAQCLTYKLPLDGLDGGMISKEKCQENTQNQTI